MKLERTAGSNCTLEVVLEEVDQAAAMRWTSNLPQLSRLISPINLGQVQAPKLTDGYTKFKPGLPLLKRIL